MSAWRRHALRLLPAVQDDALNAQNVFAFAAVLAERLGSSVELRRDGCRFLARIMRTPNQAFRRELVERSLTHFGANPVLRPLLPRILSTKDYALFRPLFATRLEPEMAKAVAAEFAAHRLLNRGDPAA